MTQPPPHTHRTQLHYTPAYEARFITVTSSHYQKPVAQCEAISEYTSKITTAISVIEERYDPVTLDYVQSNI